MATLTPNFSFILPGVNDPTDQDLWGGMLNSNFSALDTILLNQVPVGTSFVYRGGTVPVNFMLEDGSAISRTTYSKLFTAIGTTYGTGDGSTTFNLPNSLGTVDVGTDGNSNRIQFTRTITTTLSNATATINDASGLSVGMFLYSANIPAGTTISTIVGTTLTLSTGVGVTAGSNVSTRISAFNDPNVVGSRGGSQFMQQHTHGITDPGHFHPVNTNGLGNGGGALQIITASSSTIVNATAPTNNSTTDITINNSGTGNSQNIQPSLVALKMIKYQ